MRTIKTVVIHRRLCFALVGVALGLTGCAALLGEPPKGSAEAPEQEDLAAMRQIGQKAQGIIVWSSSREGNHDLFTMKTDGTEVTQITRGDSVDWLPRFSSDGTKILFCRSKKGWVSERDSNNSDKWDIHTVNVDGSDPQKVVENGSWSGWVGPNEIVFVRGTKVLTTVIGSGEEKELMDSSSNSDLDGALLQQPNVSHDGKYIAITLRGSKRETGIWSIADKTWTKTGLGCEINWTPDTQEVYWINPTGKGGSQVFHATAVNGKISQDLSDDQLRFIDMPGRRSHEYFPELSANGKWLVWGITQRGHDHDTADYEIYLWEVGTPPETAVRLTHHSANDRWPDIFLPGSGE